MLNERIGPETARFAVLGQSLPHTWSPYIHNSLFDAAGLDAIYLPVTVPPERLGSVTDGLSLIWVCVICTVGIFAATEILCLASRRRTIIVN